MTTLVYLMIMFVASPHRDAAPDRAMILALVICALASSALSLVLPEVMWKRSLSRLDLPTREARGSSASLVLRDEAPTLKVYDDPEAARLAVTGCFFSPFILGMALAESVAIFGLILGFLGSPPTVSLPFFLVSWGLLATRFPREKATLEAAEELTGVRFVAPDVAMMP